MIVRNKHSRETTLVHSNRKSPTHTHGQTGRSGKKRRGPSYHQHQQHSRRWLVFRVFRWRQVLVLILAVVVIGYGFIANQLSARTISKRDSRIRARGWQSSGDEGSESWNPLSPDGQGSSSSSLSTVTSGGIVASFSSSASSVSMSSVSVFKGAIDVGAGPVAGDDDGVHEHDHLFPDKGVIITGTCRDVEAYLPSVLANVDRLRSAFGRSYVVIFENDSSDDTNAMLRGWAIGKNATILTGIGMIKGWGRPRREVLLATARNAILKYVRRLLLNGSNSSSVTHHSRADLSVDYEYWINMDMDDVMSLKPIQPELLRSIFEQDGIWDVVCANTWPNWYYDRFALRTRDGPYRSEGCASAEDDHCHENRPIHMSAWLGPTLRGKGIPKTYPQWLQVQSCFGGLAMYNVKSTIIPGTCFFDGSDDCEHVSFHRCLRERNDARIFINPQFVPFDLEEKEIPHSVEWSKFN